jgi:hypothetical protein
VAIDQPPKAAAPKANTSAPKQPATVPVSPIQAASTKTPSGTAVAPVKPAPKPPSVSSGFASTENQPTENQPAKQVTAVAAARPVREFLSQQRVLLSTVLRVKVKDINSARAEAFETARLCGASGGVCVANTSDGQSRIEVFRFLVLPEKAGGFLSALSGLGTVLARQDEQNDITNAFNEMKAQYESMIADRNAAPGELKGNYDLQLNAMEEQLTQWEAATGNRTVTLCLVQ